MSELFGELNVEHEVRSITTCREIVTAIIEHGVTQQQLLYIIKFLAMELEDTNAMRDLAIVASDLIAASDDNQFSKTISEA